MTRIVVLGNSHVAALKTGWNEIATEHPDVEIDFFAAPGHDFFRFRLLDGLRFGITPEEEAEPGSARDVAGRAGIDLADADAVIWAGLACRFYDVADLMRGFDIEGLRAAGAPQLLSRGAFEAFAAAIAEELVPGPEWRGWTKPRLFVLPAPIRSADCLGLRAPRFRRLQFLADKGAGGREVFSAYIDHAARTFAANGVELVPQPVETLLPNGLSDTRFARGASRFTEKTAGGEDMTHMNGDFGKLHLREIFARLGLAAAPPAPTEPPAAERPIAS